MTLLALGCRNYKQNEEGCRAAHANFTFRLRAVGSGRAIWRKMAIAHTIIGFLCGADTSTMSGMGGVVLGPGASFRKIFLESGYAGETLFFDEADDAVDAVLPKPGRLLLFVASIKHCG